MNASSYGIADALLFLESKGFSGSPRHLGFDSAGSHIVSYIEGSTAASPDASTWMRSTETAWNVGRLLGRYHGAINGFVSDKFAPSRIVPRQFEGSTLCHLDTSMANIVLEGRAAIALIDFDEAAFAKPIYDLARLIRHWAPLLSDEDLDAAGQTDWIGRQHERFEALVDGYSLPRRELSDLMAAIIANADASFWNMCIGAAEGRVGYLREWHGGHADRNRRSRRWITEEFLPHVRSS